MIKYRRVFKTVVQRGRNERRGDAYVVQYVEPLSDARTKPGERRVSARRGWAGEKNGVFNTLPNLSRRRCLGG